MGRKPRWQAIVDEKPVLSRREVPASTFGGAWILDSPNKPASEIEALMQTPPGGRIPEPAPTAHTDTYDALESHLGADPALSEFEVAVLDAKAVAGLTYRQCGELLDCSASTVYRTYVEVKGRLFEKLKTDR